MKIQSPWMGRIKGSAGNMTGCKVHNKNVMRAKAFEVNNPNTAAQQVQRGYFADLTKLVASFTPDQLRTLFPSKPKTMSRRNALSKQLAEYNIMEGTEKTIDFDSIDTLGNAPIGILPSVGVTLSDNKYHIEWDNTTEPTGNYQDNIVVIVLINDNKKKILLVNTNVPLQDDSNNVNIPTEWETTDSVHGFMLIADTKNAEADFGSFIIKVRPEKKSN